MKKLYILPLLAVLFLSACSPDPVEVKAKNDYALKNPACVGILPDGRKVFRTRLVIPYAGGSVYESVYFVEQVTTVNYQTGKFRNAVVTIE